MFRLLTERISTKSLRRPSRSPVYQSQLITATQRSAVAAALAHDPIATCMVTAWTEQRGVEQQQLGGQLWTNSHPGVSLYFSSSNLIPLFGSRADISRFADTALSTKRVCTSLVGRAELVLPLWEELSVGWGHPREIRSVQPLLAMSTKPGGIDNAVRQVNMADFDRYFAVSIEMFRAEVGVDPCAADGGAGYRRRVMHLIKSGRAFAKIVNGEIIFKAEIGAQSSRVGQIQGVWTAPGHRGQGIGSGGTAAVVGHIIDSGREASLYVNSYNAIAQEVYKKIGFVEVGTFATVLID